MLSHTFRWMKRKHQEWQRKLWKYVTRIDKDTANITNSNSRGPIGIRSSVSLSLPLEFTFFSIATYIIPVSIHCVEWNNHHFRTRTSPIDTNQMRQINWHFWLKVWFLDMHLMTMKIEKYRNYAQFSTR